MTPAIERPPKVRLPWAPLASIALLIAVCYAPIIRSLVRQWIDDPDMGHGFFVPAVSAYIVWQRREEILAITPRPNWWGLLVVLFGSVQAMVGTLGVELFTSRSAIVVTLIGAVWLLGGTEILKKLAFPLFLLFFMVPIPTVVYNQLTFRLQILASRLATDALMLIQIPVLREGNVLELPTQKLSVVEACSGIRSLLSLTFLSLVYGYFFERKRWIRVTLFLTTIPIAIIANGSRVTFTGILSQIRPDLAEGFFHESTGMVIFFVAAVILFVVHQALIRSARLFAWAR
jgi:exosortase